MLGPDTDGPVEVTGPASGLWDLLAEPTDAATAAAALAAHHDADPDRVLADIEPVLTRWAADGAIEAS